MPLLIGLALGPIVFWVIPTEYLSDTAIALRIPVMIVMAGCGYWLGGWPAWRDMFRN